ncbi:hypothetical protein TWF730_000373 [Orbilia blumenaviensis]|uniref:Uncharacterized protein n=1 Tax=Orbilia blumenaviensis TaxID=1796055 RepID=A0AAV9VPH9_9PEZI
MAPDPRNPAVAGSQNTLPYPKRIKVSFNPKNDKESSSQASSESSGRSPSPVGELPDMDNMSKRELEKKIKQLQNKHNKHLKQDKQSEQERFDFEFEPSDLPPQDFTGTVDAGPLDIGARGATSSSTPFLSTPPRPTPSPLTSPEPELEKEDKSELKEGVVPRLTEEERLGMSQSDFENWVMGGDRVPAGQNLPDVPIAMDDEEKFTIIQPSEADLEAARRSYIELNGKYYDVDEGSLGTLESLGFDVTGLRAALVIVSAEKLTYISNSDTLLDSDYQEALASA